MATFQSESTTATPNHPAVETEGPTQDGRITLRLHSSMTQSMLFLLQALKASRGLRIISVAPSLGGRVEMLIDFVTVDLATAFLAQLDTVLGAIDYDLAEACEPS